MSEANVAWTKHNAARVQKLFENKVTSQQDYDAAKADEQVGQATRDHDPALLQLEGDMQGFEKIRASFRASGDSDLSPATVDCAPFRRIGLKS